MTATGPVSVSSKYLKRNICILRLANCRLYAENSVSVDSSHYCAKLISGKAILYDLPRATLYAESTHVMVMMMMMVMSLARIARKHGASSSSSSECDKTAEWTVLPFVVKLPAQMK